MFKANKQLIRYFSGPHIHTSWVLHSIWLTRNLQNLQLVLERSGPVQRVIVAYVIDDVPFETTHLRLYDELVDEMDSWTKSKLIYFLSTTMMGPSFSPSQGKTFRDFLFTHTWANPSRCSPSWNTWKAICKAQRTSFLSLAPAVFIHLRQTLFR